VLVQALENRLLAAGQAPRSVLKVRLVLSSALDQADKWGYVPRNPVALVDPPRVPADEREAIAPEQAYALLEAVRATGWRRSTSSRWRWACVAARRSDSDGRMWTYMVAWCTCAERSSVSEVAASGF
jgi:hypothetical protein